MSGPTAEEITRAEQAVLGAAMVSEQAAERIAERLTVASFYQPRHATIYTALLTAYAGAEPTEPIAITKRLIESGDIQRVGGAAYLDELLDRAPIAGAVDAAISIVVEAAQLRQISKLAATLDQARGVADPARRGAILGQVVDELARIDGPAIRESPHLAALRAALVDTIGLDGIPDPIPLVGANILYRDCLVWMVGKPGSMKSFIALDIAACVATGTDWQTNPVTQGPVLFLVAEGVSGTKKRVRAWERSMGKPMTGVQFLPVAVQANNDAQWTALVELAREERPSLIVLDTQARVTVGIEENSNSEMGGFVHQAERLRAASNACVMIVHHIGRHGDTGRGATTLDGAMSTIIKVTKDENRVTLECTKQKDSAEWDDIELRAVPVDGSAVLMLDDGLRHDPGGDVSPAALRMARTWWEHHEDAWVAPTNLVDVVAPKSTFYRHRTELKNAGIVEAGEKGKFRLLYDPSGDPP